MDLPEKTSVRRRKSPVEYVAGLLSKKAYTVAEIRKKMLQKEYPSDQIETLISDFVKQGFLNDALYAESLCRAMHASGYGKRRILAKLRTKGFSREIMESVFEKEAENQLSANPFSEDVQAKDGGSLELEAAEKALSGRLKTLQREADPRKRKEKALRFLAGRGFDASVCWEAIRLLNDE